MRFHFIAKEKANFSICRMCKVLRVSESGYYAWGSRPASQRQRDDRVYLAHIRAEHARNYRAYGRQRMTDELRDQGSVIGERRVGRLMRENDIRIVRTHKFKRTTNSNHNHNIAPNLLDGDFQATGPNQKWAGDISYLWTAAGWLYLAVIIDLYSRRVIGFADRGSQGGLPMSASALQSKIWLPASGEAALAMSWRPIELQRLPETSQRPRLSLFDVWQRELLWQCDCRNVLQIIESRINMEGTL